VNEVSDSISIVSVSQRIVTDTIYVKDEPRTWFSLAAGLRQRLAQNAIAVFDATTHSFVTTRRPRRKPPRLAVNTNGTKIYAPSPCPVTRTTIVPANKAPRNQPTPRPVT